MKKLNKKQINKLMTECKRDLANFERSIKNAPAEDKQNFKSWIRKTKAQLRTLEQKIKSGEWQIETD
jgi:hypothetical protein